MTGVRAELVFPDADNCPVADASGATDSSVQDVSWAPSSGEVVVEQFRADCDLEGFNEVFDYGSQQVYEFERDADRNCICEEIEEMMGPVTDSYARDGDLHVTIHINDVDGLREMMKHLRERFGTVSIEYLVQGQDEDDSGELVPVDMRQLTARQREVLGRAHEMGYFEYPRRANASEVSEALGIEPSTFTEHLNAAQSKLLSELLPESA